MNVSVTVEAVLEMAAQLSTVDKIHLIERIAPQIARDLSTPRQRSRKSSTWPLARRGYHSRRN